MTRASHVLAAFGSSTWLREEIAHVDAALEALRPNVEPHDVQSAHETSATDSDGAISAPRVQDFPRTASSAEEKQQRYQ